MINFVINFLLGAVVAYIVVKIIWKMDQKKSPYVGLMLIDLDNPDRDICKFTLQMPIEEIVKLKEVRFIVEAGNIKSLLRSQDEQSS